MGRFFIILFGLISFANVYKSNAQKNYKASFDITVTEINPYIKNTYSFKNKNIKILKGGFSEWDSIRSFTKELSGTEFENLITRLEEINFKEEKRDSIPKNFNDHALTFEFKVQINNITYTLETWGAKVNPYYRLVSILNDFVPDEFKIGYVNEYFEGSLQYGY